MNRLKYKELFNKIDRKQFENEYLICLGLKTTKNGTTKANNKMNNKWKKIKESFSCSNELIRECPDQIEGILTAPYEKLADLFKIMQNENHEDGLKENFEKIFQYDNFKRKIYLFFNKYLDTLDLCRCPYCDTSFSGFCITNDKSEERSIYDLDHFFPKSDYPLFALSLYNFIPSCQYCNERIKNSKFIDLYKLDLSKPDEVKKKLLESSPASDKYNFKTNVPIRFMPQKNNSDDKNAQWHYAPLSQKTESKYKVYFDSQIDSQYQTIIREMRLEERYNSQAIKMNGLYLIDLRKRYPHSHIEKICKLLNNQKTTTSNSIIPATEEQIENDIFHNDNKYALLQKMKNDLLE